MNDLVAGYLSCVSWKGNGVSAVLLEFWSGLDVLKGGMGIDRWFAFLAL